MEAHDEDPQADWYALEDETKDGLIDLYREVGVFADQTIEQLPLDAQGQVPWWRPGKRVVTLHRVILQVPHARLTKEFINRLTWMSPCV